VPPRVSVIVAARDAARTIGETLESVKTQTFGDWELVVVDDGSQDATGALAEAAGARVLRNERALGPGAARNQAAAAAAGELLAILDADDLFLPPYLERQLAVYETARAEGRRVGAVCCDAELLAESGPTGRRWSDRVGKAERIDLATLLEENVVFGLALVPKAVFAEVGGYDEDPAMGVEDYDLWVRIAERGYEIVSNPDVLALYRLGTVSRSAQVERESAAGRLLFERVLARGELTRRERRIARRRRRVHTVVLLRARLAAQPSPARKLLLGLRLAPLALLSALEHPSRWRHWLRGGVRPADATRHLRR
jgi:glycosyltransferase involved in cell wall biosynthesis